MNRRHGISILSVLSLTIGVLVAEYAFAPLRDPYPSADQPSPRSDAESTASPREVAPAAPTNQGQPPPLPVERRDAAGEAEGDPMMAAVARPVIDAVWQTPGDSAVRVSLVPTTAFVGREPAMVVASSGGFINVGGAFFGTKGASVTASQSVTTPVDSPADTNPPSDTASSDAGPVITEDSPSDAGGAPEESMAMNDAPNSSLPESEETPPSPPTATVPDANEAMTPTQPWIEMPLESPPSVPHVTVPEPLPSSLFLFGILLVVLSRRRRPT